MPKEGSVTVGVLSPMLGGAFFAMVLSGICEEVAGAGGRVVAIQTRDAEGARYPWCPPPFGLELGTETLDGYIVVLNAVDDDFLAHAQAQGTPVVLVCHRVAGLSCPEVVPDDITVLGFDDTDLAVRFAPPGPSGPHDFRPLGRAAALQFMALAGRRPSRPGQHLAPWRSGPDGPEGKDAKNSRNAKNTTSGRGQPQAPVPAPSLNGHGHPSAANGALGAGSWSALAAEGQGGWAPQAPALPGPAQRAVLNDDYHVCFELAGMTAEGNDPKSLSWLRRSRVSSACLALWERDPSSLPTLAHGLRIAGIVGPHAAERMAVGSYLDVASFPPVDALSGAHRPTDDLVMALPVRTPSSFWGFLVLAVRPDAAAGGDVYFLWAALLASALDHQALVEEIRSSEERYALAARAANDGLWDWDLNSGTVFYSPRWKAMLGYEDHEVGSAPSEWFSRVHPDDLPGLEAVVALCLEAGSGSLEHEHRARTKQGAYRWLLCRALAVQGSAGRPARLVGSLTDVTERKELEGRLRQAALYDSLTGLPNRSLFMDRLVQSVTRAKRSPGYHFCVLFMDLDGFKTVNDTLGHMAGDLLLMKVAERITRHLRQSDTAVRFGGDEFAILLDNLSGPEGAAPIVSRLQETLSAPYDVEGSEVVVTATIGVAVSSDGYDNPEDMVKDADTAMYSAKARSRAATEGNFAAN